MAQFSPNKRLKTETQTLNLNPPISPSSAKGKAPITDDEDGYESPGDLPPQNCGICFSEQGKSVRGLIDSCDHHFCFLCIIEWSKIESRCPLCRARFSAIRRVRKDGTFIGDSSVCIPVRDQIYDPFGEPVDPYAQAKCTICNGTTDESLLLLCDLCDSPWHTYCAGLGVTVPEGDWFCRDCSLLRAEQIDSEVNDKVDGSAVSEHDEESSAHASVSIFDIVRDPTESKHEHGVDRLRKLVSPTKKFSCPTIASGQENVTYAGSLQNSGGNLSPRIDVTGSSARTLRNCRNVRKHINVLRDNWDALRTGSLSFSSNFSGPSRKDGGKSNFVAKCAERSSESHSFSTPSSFQSKGQGVFSSVLPSKHPYDVDRAWKFMNIAKKSMRSVVKSKSPTKIVSANAHVGKLNNATSKCLPAARKSASTCSSKSQNYNTSRLSLSRNVQTPPQPVFYHDSDGLLSGKLCRLPTFFDDGFAYSRSSCGPIAGTSNVSSMKPHKKEISSRPCDQVRSLNTHSTREAEVGTNPSSFCSVSSHSRRPMAGGSDVSHNKLRKKEISTCPNNQLRNADNCSTSKAEVQTSAQADIYSDTVGFPSVQNFGGELSNVFDECKEAAPLTLPHGPLKGASDASCGKLNSGEVSACPGKVGAKISNKISRDEEAKSEIQSLVKLNLKLLSKHKQLGADAFKDIARISTHTILAACGFQHRKIVLSCPTLVCNHNDRTQLQHRSCRNLHKCILNGTYRLNVTFAEKHKIISKWQMVFICIILVKYSMTRKKTRGDIGSPFLLRPYLLSRIHAYHHSCK